MSIESSLSSALSGLDTQATAMQIIGDNIANLHTPGFKSSSVQFEDVLGMSLSSVTGMNRTGVGAKVSSVDGNFTQGTLMSTGVDTDVAINGRGFFILEDPGSDEKFYSRSGHFSVDAEGYFVNNQGQRVQGYLYDEAGVTLMETLADIRINRRNMVPPKETGAVEVVVNLDTRVTAGTFDLTDPGGSSQYSTAVQIYDNLGEAHSIQVYFTKTAPQAWTWNGVIDGSDIVGGTPGTPVPYGQGTLTFDTDGKLTTAMPVAFKTETLTFANGIAAAATTLDLTGSSQYGSASSIQSIVQDGYAAGNLSGITIDAEGKIVGNYTNGAVKKIAQLALADFTNLHGLQRSGAMLFLASAASGDPLFNRPGVGGLGTLSASMLEESNVDLAAEFIRMILTQRGYQANSKVISTTDEMLAQLISIK